MKQLKGNLMQKFNITIDMEQGCFLSFPTENLHSQ